MHQEEELHPLIHAVLNASRRPEALASADALYRDVQLEIDRRRPICLVSGRCCRFDDFRHRLYVTTLELAHFLHHLPPAQPRIDNPGGCPFQLNKLCTVHSFRPFGCRIFFCDASSTEWQNALYEQFHADLKRLHETLDVPYFYLEWRQALQILLPAASV
jgi:Fe-S-cluster containining protein